MNGMPKLSLLWSAFDTNKRTFRDIARMCPNAPTDGRVPGRSCRRTAGNWWESCSRHARFMRKQTSCGCSEAFNKQQCSMGNGSPALEWNRRGSMLGLLMCDRR